MRQTSLSGKPYRGGHGTALDPLEEWEGSRTFRDARSPTGWVDAKNHVIGGVTVNGVPLLLTKAGKLAFNPSRSRGGLFSGVAKVFVPGLAALEFQESVTSTVFGDDVAEFAQGLVPTVANAVIPGSGAAVGLFQNVQGLVDGSEAPDLLPSTFSAPPLVPDLAVGEPSPTVPPIALVAGLVLLILLVRQ